MYSATYVHHTETLSEYVKWTLNCIGYSTLCSEKKHPLIFSFISPWIICVFKQKLQWIYPRIDRFWQCKN